MDRTNLHQVNALYDEEARINQVLESFDNGGVIVGLAVGFPPELGEDEEPLSPLQLMSMGVQVPTIGMTYPQAMVDSIQQAMVERLNAINAELAQLGVTGG